MNMLERIQENFPLLSKSERKVAEVIVNDPQTAIKSSIATLAKLALVSEPTVNRFCRRLDTKGFPDFKLHLAQSLANGSPYVSRHVETNDSSEAYTNKIFESSMAVLDAARQSIDPQSVNRAVDMLTQADNICFFGLGASAAVARDAQNKFIRFNVPVSCFDDVLMMRMSCINAKEESVIVLFSHTGRTKALIEIAELAKEHHAQVIAITCKDSPLANVATLAITMDIQEEADVYIPMASRLAQMVAVDVLATGFTLRRGPRFRENLIRVKELLRESRLDPNTNIG